MNMNSFIVGKRVILRTLCIKDVKGPYVSWFNDEVVCRYNQHHVFAYDKSQAEEYIRKATASRNELVLAINTKRGAKHIGNIALQKIDLVSRNAMVSIVLGDKDYWGKGYAKEAMLLLLEHGFSQMNLHRICCGTAADNVAMQNLAISVGMKKEGRRREAAFKAGRYVDIMEYGLLKRDYIRRNINE
jgi:RimJ/RimL family protein N-acetyltransferase